MTRLADVADEFCSRWLGQSGPGLAVGVVQDGEVLLARGYGLADLGSGSEMGPNTIGYVGSVAKQFTAASAILASEGALSIDDKVRRWIPELPPWAEGVTVDHLLHHTAGFRDYFGYLSLQGKWPDADYGPNALIGDLARQDRLNFRPGERFMYSNTNYVLLSVTLERATGTPLAEFASTLLFQPLGMADSFFLAGHRPAGPQVAVAYRRGDSGEWTESDPLLGVVGDGGMRSTVSDLLKWADACIHGRLPPRLWPMLCQRGQLNDGRIPSYARGVDVRVWVGRPSVRHGGGLGAWNAFLVAFPEDTVGIAVLGNAGDLDAPALARTLAEAIFPGPPPTPSQTKPVPAALQGVWLDGDLGIVMNIYDQGNKVILDLFDTKEAITGISEDAASVDAWDLHLTVGAGPGGRILRAAMSAEPWATLRPRRMWHPENLDEFTGTFTSPEFDATWDITADDGHLTVGHLPTEQFRSIIKDIFTSGSTTLRYHPDASGQPAHQITVYGPRGYGYTLARTQPPLAVRSP